MDFFAQQERARRNTGLMVFLFLLAVAVIVLAVDIVLAIAWGMFIEDTSIAELAGGAGRMPWEIYLGGALVTLGFIAAGSVQRMLQLSQGGAAVAELVGARRVARNSLDPLERRLLNVVEEMAIASGITMPLVFVMDEEKGINAFAAGYSPNEAAVTVTRGTLERLGRDELQGVIGHEFSHILNGDMRLNVRLLAVVSGIMVISTVGRSMMRASSDNTDRDTTFNRDERKSGINGIFFLGLALLLIGWIGVFFGRMIKAAVSREREYLADAASVQFTRNPEGIAGALYTIGSSSGVIANPHAEELSHMYFGNPVRGGLFDTHPPVEDRIRRLMGERGLLFLRSRANKAAALTEPSSDGIGEVSEIGGLGESGGAASAFAGGQAGAMRMASVPDQARRTSDRSVSTSARDVVESVGKPTHRHMDYARGLLLDMPELVRQAIVTVEGAQAALYALLIASGGEVRGRQAALIAASSGQAMADRALALEEAFRPLGPAFRLPLLDLAVPTLRDLPPASREALLAQMQSLVEADRRVTLFEFVMLTLCRRHFVSATRGAPPVKYRSAQAAAVPAALVLSLLAHAGKSGENAFAGACGALGIRGQSMRAPAELKFPAVEAALRELNRVAPLAKPAFIKACLAVVMSDDRISTGEAELIRAICAALDSPLPPILGAEGA